MLLNRQGGQSKDALHPLAGERRGEQHRSPIEEIELGAQLLFHRRHGVAVFFHRVPFVDDHHAGTAVLFNAARQALILLGHPIEGIDHQNTHITAFNGLETPVDAEEFRAVIDAATPADARRVHQAPGTILANDAGVNRVASGAADGADNRPLLSADGIQQTGFPDIRPSDDGHLNRLLLVTLLILRGQKGEHLIQQFSSASAVDGRDRMGFTQAKAPKFAGHRQALFRRLALVHRQKRGTAVTA